MARQDPQVNVRIPEKTLERFKEETQKDRRTITAQLNMIIEEWLEKRENQNEAKALNQQTTKKPEL
ncbi:Arc family DNA-binding protein [Acinetobacter haemolyticus]|uniref:Arc family DNA-binding protein n=2 Tax=Moraxellaceae TaxID=468 RepID=UPI0013734B47|nr:Arc family DNA-binding protein [Acinetobacter haemolyticus]NAR84989.1 Arc family DNA-binding protein [Acinetobacter haemolyticus]